VVEDDEEISNALISLLEDEGFPALGARDGHQALEVVRGMAGHVGLILLDLMMPRMDGWQFRDEQLRDERLRSIPVVVLSACGASLADRTLMDPAEVLNTPVAVDALLHAVLRHFRRFN
jgi:CheY-like chemotaxis protein